MSDAHAAHRRLVEELTAGGLLPDGWREVFATVPRHVFVPAVVWDDDGQPLHRDDEPDRWLAVAYADDAVVTQLDHGSDPVEGKRREVTSSVSMPSVVAEMLVNLDLHPGMRVLEIGTGAGYNAALLCARVGEGNVTSIEVDPTLAEGSIKALAEAGWHPRVVSGDGAGGYESAAPYDRVIATCSVAAIPHAWVAQLRPGGKIVTPYATGYMNGAQLLLTAQGAGTATGRIVGGCAFLRLRDQRLPFGWIEEWAHDEDSTIESTTRVDLLEARSLEAGLVIGALVPDAHAIVGFGGEDQDWTLWLFDHAGSWAAVDYTDGAEAFPVEQHGDRALWDEIAAAYDQWVTRERPVSDRLGVTVTPDRQWIWLDTPDREITP